MVSEATTTVTLLFPMSHGSGLRFGTNRSHRLVAIVECKLASHEPGVERDRVGLLPLPARNERGEGRGEGKSNKDGAPPSPPPPSPPSFLRRRGRSRRFMVPTGVRTLEVSAYHETGQARPHATLFRRDPGRPG